MDTCKIKNCSKSVRSYGMCQTHYYRWYVHGDPEIVMITPAATPMRERLTPDKWDVSPGPLESPCWIWNRLVVQPSGYGTLKFHQKSIKAHRAMYSEFVGPIPEGLLVLHKCDVRLCVNPEHLFVGTNDDNMKDMAEKKRGRGARGATDEEMRRAKAMIRGGMSQAEVSKITGISPSTLSLAMSGKLYRDIE